MSGASRGIGAAIAREAIARGDSVAVVARRDPGAVLDGLAPDEAGRVQAISADLADPQAPARVAAEAAERLGGLDVLVNNAARHRGGRIERLDEGEFESVVDLNLLAPFRLCRAAVPHLADGGAIVNIGAVVGLRGFSGDAPYGASKAGLVGLTLVLAIELARRRITVNAVIPGFTETEMTKGLDERARQQVVRRIPLGRTAEPEEIAKVVGWVASTPYMTGAVVPVDGGLMAGLGGR